MKALLVRRNATDCNKGFSLIELLVALAVIALLIALLLPVIAKARANAQRLVCLANVRSIGQASALYASDHDGSHPHWSGWQVWGGQGDGQGGDEAGLGWTELLGTHIENSNIFLDPARPREEAPIAYFIAARFSWFKYQRQFSSVNNRFVLFPSSFVKAGDCNDPGLFVHPYGTVTDRLPDCDQDDATQPTLFFEGELTPHGDLSNIVFFDGHAASFSEYEPSTMTWHARKMLPWSLEPLGDD
ncbi:MAG: prepilin-type N-terminal cleavage/methylation domain-containing protein [Planctomycetota bacterium]